MAGGFSKVLHKLYNTPFRKIYLSTKLKLLCMLNYSHSYGMSKAYVTGSQARQSNIWTYEILSSNTETEILRVKLKVKTVHPLNLLHSRLWLYTVISATLTIFRYFHFSDRTNNPHITFYTVTWASRNIFPFTILFKFGKHIQNVHGQIHWTSGWRASRIWSSQQFQQGWRSCS